MPGMQIVFWLFTQPVNKFWLQSTSLGDFGEAFFDVGSGTHRVRPTGIIHEITATWQGYDPSRVRAPVAIIRGEWDSMCTDADAGWLGDALSGSPTKSRREDQ